VQAVCKAIRIGNIRRPQGSSAAFEYRDADIKPGESYYYVRVEQAAGQLAWSSPIWVDYSR
jgi:hypothetical protein